MVRGLFQKLRSEVTEENGESSRPRRSSGGSRSKRTRGSADESSYSLLWMVARWFTPSLTVTGVLAALIGVVTGKVHLPTLDSLRGTEPPLVEDPIASVFTTDNAVTASPGASGISPVGLTTASKLTAKFDAASKSSSSIRIATYNIQMFGKTKAERPEVVDALARICLLFDVVAIQEVKGDPAIPLNALTSQIEKFGGRYQAIVGPPLGRTTQTECYAYVWDQQRIDLVPDSHYTVEDNVDRMHREPFVASFQTRVTPTDSQRPFRFTMINAHTDPDEVFGQTPENELNVLDDVFNSVRNWQFQYDGEDDYMLVGDLNVDVKGLKELGSIPNVISMVGDVPTNTAGSKTYDHILFDRAVTGEAMGRQGVLNVQEFLGIDRAAADAISDHLPVWAEFSVYEIPPVPRTASRTPSQSQPK